MTAWPSARRLRFAKLVPVAAATVLVANALAAAPRSPDFDNDGDPDLAIGAPLCWSQYPLIDSAGTVVFADGTSTGAQYLPVEDEFIDGITANEQLGTSIAWGHFSNFDGHFGHDIATGAPFRDVGNFTDAGAVVVMLDPVSQHTATHTRQTVAGNLGSFDRFGFALATGDFQRDGWDDLAVGAPGDGAYTGGSVSVLTKPFSGGTSYTFDQAGLGFSSSNGDEFGKSLAAGDFNCDGYEDLAIGAPGAAVNGEADAGRVFVLYGGANGLNPPTATQEWHQDVSGMVGIAEAGDEFGWSLAVGNFDGYSYANRPCNDLVVGIPKEDIGAAVDAGAVQVLFGSPFRLTANANQLWYGHLPSLGGISEAGDEFGYSVAIGRLNNDTYDDLIIGIPGENSDVGYIQLLKGSSVGLTGDGDVLWSQGTPGTCGVAEVGDRFGEAVGGSGEANLSVGVPGEDDPTWWNNPGYECNIKLADSGNFLIDASDQYRHLDFGHWTYQPFPALLGYGPRAISAAKPEYVP